MSIPRRIRHAPLLSDLPREVLALAVVAFCVALGFGILAPAIPVFAREFDVSALAASAVISAFALVRLVTSPLSGWLTDRFGERAVLATGLVIVAVSSAAAGFSQTFGQLLVLRGAGGLGSSMFTVSVMALLLRTVNDNQRGRAVSAYQGGFLVGGIAGPAVGGLVVAWSIRAPFFVYAGTLTLAIVVALVLLGRTHPSAQDQHDAADDDATTNGSKLEAMRAALRSRAYRAALGVNLVTGFVVFGLRGAAIPLFVVEGLGRGPSMTGIGFFLAAAVQAVLLLPAGRMADTQGRRKALLIGSGTMVLSMAVLTAADAVMHGSVGGAAVIGLTLFLASMLVGGLSAAFLGGAPAAVVGDVVGGRRGGIPVAAFQMTADLGAIAGPLVAGLLIDTLNYAWVFGVGTALAVSAVILVLAMPETLPGHGRRSEGDPSDTEPDARAPGPGA